MLKKTFTLFIFLFSLSSLATIAQDSQKILKQAIKLQEMGNFPEALPLYREVLMYDNLAEAKKGLAYCYKEVKDYNKAEYWYKVLINIFPGDETYLFNYAQMLQQNGRCDEAKEWFKKYSLTDPKGMEFADACEDASKFMQDEDKYILFSMPFNSELAEFAPVFHKSGIVFTGGGMSDAKNGQFTDLYYTEKLQDYTYDKPTKLKGKINSNFHDGPATFSADGKEIWLTRTGNVVDIADKESKGNRNLKIYYAKDFEGKWGPLEEFMHNNPAYTVAHPSLSADGSAVIFASNMPGGYGESDLYISYRRDTLWTEPLNLGPNINTIANEMFPFLHSDGTLYFTSNGHPGLGGLDIFSSVYEREDWTKPENFGAPINSAGDDLTITLNFDKTVGYFSSDRYGGQGRDDLYYFERRDRVIAATPPTDPAAMEEEKAPLAGIDLVNELNLRDIVFDYKKSNLNTDAYKELLKVVDYMQINPYSRIIIESHTDSRELASTNLAISQERADNIKAFLLANNIAEDRLKTIACGEDYLLKNCEGSKCSESDHNKNDRIIFKLNIATPEEDLFGDEPEESEFLDFEVVEYTQKELDKQEKEKRKKERSKPIVKNGEMVDNIDGSKKVKMNKADKKEKKDKKPKKEKEEKIKKVKVKDESNKKDRSEKKEKKPKKVKVKEEKTQVIVKKPTFKTVEKTEGITFRVHTGPYKNIDIDLIRLVQDLDVDSKTEFKGSKETITLGVFKTIYDSQKVVDYLQASGYPKSKIVVYQNGVATKESVSNLLKKGFR